MKSTIIAEIGSNWEGNMNTAEKIIKINQNYLIKFMNNNQKT